MVKSMKEYLLDILIVVKITEYITRTRTVAESIHIIFDETNHPSEYIIRAYEDESPILQKNYGKST